MHGYLPFIVQASLFLGLVSMVIAVVVALHRARIAKMNYPPGPPTLPIIGNLHQMALEPVPIVLRKWAKIYGEVFTVHMGALVFVIINSEEAATDLLIKKGASTSSRVPFFMSTTIMDRAMFVMPYDGRWRKHRKLAVKITSPKAIESYEPIFDSESRKLLNAIIEGAGPDWKSPILVDEYSNLFTFSTILRVLFGVNCQGMEDPVFQENHHLLRHLVKLTNPIGALLDFIPAFRYIPIPPFSSIIKMAHDGYLYAERVWGGLVKDMEDRMHAGTDVPICAARMVLEDKEKEELDHYDCWSLLGTMVSGGVESTSSALSSIIGFMAHCPDIQAKAQEELDRVVGSDRLPNSADEPDLKYIRAIIKEALRIKDPAPLGVPHYTVTDETWNGYFIPANTGVVLNHNAIHLDSEKYPDSLVFRPERFLNWPESSAFYAINRDQERDHWVFGAGRRICTGMRYAEHELLVGVSRLLWAFKFIEIPEAPFDPLAMVPDFIQRPPPFHIRFAPRDEARLKLI